METQKMGSFYFAGVFYCQEASSSTAGEYRTAACQGLACTPRKRSMSQRRPYLSVLKPGYGLDPIRCVE